MLVTGRLLIVLGITTVPLGPLYPVMVIAPLLVVNVNWACPTVGNNNAIVLAAQTSSGGRIFFILIIVHPSKHHFRGVTIMVGFKNWKLLRRFHFAGVVGAGAAGAT